MIFYRIGNLHILFRLYNMYSRLIVFHRSLQFRKMYHLTDIFNIFMYRDQLLVQITLFKHCNIFSC